MNAAGENERLVGRALGPIRDQVVIATNFRVETRPREQGSVGRFGAVSVRPSGYTG